ncbi:Hypothetical protein, putative [Bodo saltans]|uniref:Uncharacterized protein n=1 Tax=Bodo saltans TaxID=75058 RepID=A0A0S4JE81_BODSA|nr:Hypothetical protein, putative [Bodo saltans]|eukprot:CUG89894.1 Hypothetical protein, putative [Bodo saltans]
MSVLERQLRHHTQVLFEADLFECLFHDHKDHHDNAASSPAPDEERREFFERVHALGRELVLSWAIPKSGNVLIHRSDWEELIESAIVCTVEGCQQGKKGDESNCCLQRCAEFLESSVNLFCNTRLQLQRQQRSSYSESSNCVAPSDYVQRSSWSIAGVEDVGGAI